MTSLNVGCSAARTPAGASTPMIVDTGTWIPAQQASVANHGRSLPGLMADLICELAATNRDSLSSGATSATGGFRRRPSGVPSQGRTCSRDPAPVNVDRFGRISVADVLNQRIVRIDPAYAAEATIALP